MKIFLWFCRYSISLFIGILIVIKHIPLTWEYFAYAMLFALLFCFHDYAVIMDNTKRIIKDIKVVRDQWEKNLFAKHIPEVSKKIAQEIHEKLSKQKF